ncbi:MAG TPA: hypothetical protein PKA00_19205 [Saprospiraceae bacterium]|nr:hypothetical protein [Saprospiraceae bacterium]HMQ85046.1 hypothetical protein [Saprospiraceae bacterium]
MNKNSTSTQKTSNDIVLAFVIFLICLAISLYIGPETFKNILAGIN